MHRIRTLVLVVVGSLSLCSVAFAVDRGAGAKLSPKTVKAGIHRRMQHDLGGGSYVLHLAGDGLFEAILKPGSQPGRAGAVRVKGYADDRRKVIGSWHTAVVTEYFTAKGERYVMDGMDYDTGERYFKKGGVQSPQPRTEAEARTRAQTTADEDFWNLVYPLVRTY